MFKRIFALVIVCMMMASLVMAQQAQQGAQRQAAPAQTRQPAAAPGTVTFNTVFTKLKAGQQVFCNTLTSPDTAAARKACQGVDYIWIEMQHSPMNWESAAALCRVIVSAGSIPFIRVPQASNASDIQKATDCGALGIIVPMVESVEEARNAVWFARNPVGNLAAPNVKPWGRRSSGSGQAGSLWGSNYSTNYNNNIFIMIQIESPAGTGLIDDILDQVPGINGVMVASSDFGNQAGDRDGSATYNAREEIVRKSVLAHGLTLVGPSNWANREGYMMFQGTRPNAQGQTSGNDSGSNTVAPRQGAPAGR